MEDFISDIFDEMREAQARFSAESMPVLIGISTEIVRCFENGGKVLIFGNGGSAADSQHIAAEFTNRFKMERPPLPALALTTDTSALTAIGNDYSFEQVFDKQLKALGNANDIAWGISTSGNSPNVLAALRTAGRQGMTTIGFTGKDGGLMRGLCDHLLISPSECTPRIQEIHIAAAHIICELVDEIMFGKFS
ncbi:SIS domain-containing protein [Geovibrio thiophilus]|uniref:Phosphoheptose isomerase n=1 Tax=Geovibrio thiophilus TaxID=139438 RepID=A0A410JV40_9BACT|nr:D-sedoheptulose 7-phosphate isomerase [Geovibrio thiophilus]QAR31921.1 SIS domain-containing protein [Geovibrio thiophilus]